MVKGYRISRSGFVTPNGMTLKIWISHITLISGTSKVRFWSFLYYLHLLKNVFPILSLLMEPEINASSSHKQLSSYLKVINHRALKFNQRFGVRSNLFRNHSKFHQRPLRPNQFSQGFLKVKFYYCYNLPAQIKIVHW